MLTEAQHQSLLPQSAHSNQTPFLLILFDDVHHSFEYHILNSEVEHRVAVGIVEHHLVDVDGLTTLAVTALFLYSFSYWREQYRVLCDHSLGVTEIACKEYAAHVAIEQQHGGTRDMPGVEHPEMHIHLLVGRNSHLDSVANPKIASDDPGSVAARLGKLVKYEQLSGGCAIDIAVVPEGSESLPMVAMEVREEMQKRIRRKRLTEVEIIDHNVGISQQSHGKKDKQN